MVNLDSKKVTGIPMPAKVKDVIKALNVSIQGPIWHIIMKVAKLMISKAQALPASPSINIKQLVPLLELREAKNWQVIGFQTLSEI